MLPRNANWNLVQESLVRLREDNDRFEQFCSEQLDAFDERGAQLVEREQQLARQHAEANRDLSEARFQLERLTSTTRELADSRAEVAQLRAQLEQQQQITATAIDQAAKYEQQVRELRQEVASLAEEAREARHAADAHKRHIAEERAEWLAELLRSAFEREAPASADMQDGDLKVVHHELEAAVELAAASAGRIDPVLSAVMAQFETLQKGRDRLAAGAKSGRQGVA